MRKRLAIWAAVIGLTWGMVTDSEGQIADKIALTDTAIVRQMVAVRFLIREV